MSKPLVLVFPFDLLSHYLRCLEIAKKLSGAYDFRFVHSPKFNEYITEAGFGIFDCESFDPEKVMPLARKFDFSWLDPATIEIIYKNQIRVIEELQPAIVVGDTSPTLKMAAEKTGTPFITLMNGYMTKHYARVRKLSVNHPAHKMLQKFPGKVQSGIVAQAEKMALKAVHKPFRQLRMQEGLGKTADYFAELEGDLNLICDFEEMYPQKELPESFRFVGAIKTAVDATEDSKPLKISENRKTILVTMGSSGDWDKVDFLHADFFNRFNLILAGYKGQYYSNSKFNARSFINLDEIMPEVDLVICHGGNGTVNAAISHGVPVIGLPSHFEQEWNMQGVEEIGFGETMPAKPDMNAIKCIVQKWVEVKELLGLEPVVESAISWSHCQDEELARCFESAIRSPSENLRSVEAETVRSSQTV